jgi:acyl carrier protein
LLRNLDSETVFKALVAAVVDEFAVIPHEVVLVRPASIAKTSSGKVQRSLCREYYLQDQLDEVARWSGKQNGASVEPIPVHRNASMDFASADSVVNRKHIAQKIAETVASHLKVEPEQISTTTPWAELGVDSLQAVRLARILEETMGCKLESTVLWECSNIEELAACMAITRNAAGLESSASVRGGRAGRPDACQPASGGCAQAAAARSAEAVMQLSEEEAMALLVDEIER